MLVHVEASGLAEFAADLKKVAPRLARELAQAHKAVASAVADQSRTRMRGLPVPRAFAAASGIQPRATDRFAAVSLLGDNPWVRAVEFGAETHVVFGRRVAAASMRRRVFAPWSGSGEDSGYALAPTLRVFMASKLDQTYIGALDQAHRQAFPKGQL